MQFISLITFVALLCIAVNSESMNTDLLMRRMFKSRDEERRDEQKRIEEQRRKEQQKRDEQRRRDEEQRAWADQLQQITYGSEDS